MYHRGVFVSYDHTAFKQVTPYYTFLFKFICTP